MATIVSSQITKNKNLNSDQLTPKSLVPPSDAAVKINKKTIHQLQYAMHH